MTAMGLSQSRDLNSELNSNWKSSDKLTKAATFFDLYGEGAWFESGMGHGLSRLRMFAAFLNPSNNKPK